MREPELLDLTNFIEDKMTLVNNRLFFREDVGWYNEKPKKPIRQKFCNYSIIGTGDIIQQATKGKCPIWEKNYDTEECATFLAQSIEDSCKTLYKKEVILWMPLWDLKGT